jgi:hypothetical protein
MEIWFGAAAVPPPPFLKLLPEQPSDDAGEACAASGASRIGDTVIETRVSEL